jgi:ribosome biogenesis SPOUT family RNA methylase Rps3
MKFIIEHLEPELFEWCILEYKHISEIVGKDNLIFTNIIKDKNKLKGLGKVHKESVKELDFQNSCILDPFAEKTFSSKDKFDYLILGGILGDYPMKKRTEIELSSKMNVEKRNLGKEQMSTDTAVYVANEITKGKTLNDFEFKDEIEIELEKEASIQLPFRYVIINGKPMLPKGLIKYLKKRPF